VYTYTVDIVWLYYVLIIIFLKDNLNFVKKTLHLNFTTLLKP